MSGQEARSEYIGEHVERGTLIGYSDARTTREFISNLNIDSPPPVVRGTGIVCTIGPACQSVDKLRELMQKGLNIARCVFFARFFHKKPVFLLPKILSAKNISDTSLIRGKMFRMR